MGNLTFTGEASTFEALREYLNMNAPTVFAHVIERLDKALIKHRADVEFEPIGKYLRLEFDDTPSIRDQIYRNGEIQTCIAYFSQEENNSWGYLKHIPQMVLEIIEKLKLNEDEVHVAEDFIKDAMDESEPVMVMVIHSGKFAGTLIKFKGSSFKWVRPDEHCFSIGCIPWKRYTEFKTVDEFIQQFACEVLE